MNEFFTWEVLLTFTGLTSVVYMITEFTKGISFIKKIPTKYWSYLIALILLFAVNIITKNFKCEDIILYIINAIPISLSANGLKDFNIKKTPTDKEVG